MVSALCMGLIVSEESRNLLRISATERRLMVDFPGSMETGRGLLASDGSATMQWYRTRTFPDGTEHTPNLLIVREYSFMA